jgi:hypothetical protein
MRSPAISASPWPTTPGFLGKVAVKRFLTEPRAKKAITGPAHLLIWTFNNDALTRPRQWRHADNNGRSYEASQTARLSLWFHKGIAPETTPQKLCSHLPVLKENNGVPAISSIAMLARTMQRESHGMITNNAVTRPATDVRRSTNDSDLAELAAVEATASVRRCLKGHSISTKTAVDQGRRVSWHV